MDEEGRTALGAARERFLGSLAQRARELRELLDAVAAEPSDGAPRERLRRRVHALYASAQVFQNEPLADAIKELVQRLDEARDEDRELSPEDVAAASALTERLGGGAPEPASESRPRPSAPSNDQISSVFRLDALGDDVDEPVEAPAVVAQTVAGQVAAPRVLGVLVVTGPELGAALREALPLEHCDLTTSYDPETAVEVLDNVAPDVVLLDAHLARHQGGELVERLRGVRTDVVKAVVLCSQGPQRDGEALARSTGADARIELPLAPSELLHRLHQLAFADDAFHSALAKFEGGTVDEIAQSVAEEVRRGIAESLRQGGHEHIELEDKAELMAATWSAIGRIRAHLAERTEGRVLFSDRPYAGGPAELALTDDLPAAPYAGVGDALRGRQILVADDDPAVLWFFCGLLREAGAVVHEAEDGKQALELARRRVPDVVISDILMPEIDGFALCRELERDLLLSHVPVVLLSWKEDFLQRMRELESGASGYLRKEAGSHQILATIAGVLRPRVELEALLSAGDEVQGRVDAIGVRNLIETVAARHGSARITVRDAWNLFEVDVRDGNRLSVTRTASDGSFSRKEPALRQLLAVDVGRFGVTSAEGALRGGFDVPLDQALVEAGRKLAALVDAVSDRWLVRVGRVELDDEVLATLLTATPTVLAEVVACLKQVDQRVSDLLVNGSFPARELEQHLRELARRGAITAVIGHDGEDLVAEAERERIEHPGVLLHSSERPAAPSIPPTTLGDGDVEWIEGGGHVAGGAAADRAPVELIEAPPIEEEEEEESQDLSVPPPLPTRTFTAPSEESVSAMPPPLPVGEGHSTAPDPPEPEPAPTSEPEPDCAPEPDAQGFAVRSSLLTQPPAERSRSVAPDARPEERSPLAVMAMVAALFGVIGFVGYRWVNSPGAAGTEVRPGSATPAIPSAPEPEPAPGAGPKPGSPPQGAAGEPSVAPTFGRVLPFIDHSRGVPVGESQGLLLIEYEADGTGPKVRIGDRSLGPAPTGVALDGGRHQLVIERDGQTSFRFLTIEPGETRIVEVK
ncbi:MAG: response regulator [Myxococcales bacterium]|nr:response regulator [Myxococcales bacterium]